ncbi:MAG: glucosylglycerol hydrolase, partial [Synechococcus sp.]|nr:glucosylglycerol hydrolase [Synechococcus sp.]
ERLDLLATPATTIFYGLRWAPAAGEEGAHPATPPDGVALVAHMGGEAMAVRLPELFPQHPGGWMLRLASPGLELPPQALAGLDPIELRDSQALLLEPQPPFSNSISREK